MGEDKKMRNFKDYRNIDIACENVIFEHEQEGIQEAEYQGRKVTLNNPMRTPKGPRKFSVYVKETTQQEENHLELDIIVITQDQKQKLDIGLVINGELELK
mgnify:CR=1 FL=1